MKFIDKGPPEYVVGGPSSTCMSRYTKSRTWARRLLVLELDRCQRRRLQPQLRGSEVCRLDRKASSESASMGPDGLLVGSKKVDGWEREGKWVFVEEWVEAHEAQE